MMKHWWQMLAVRIDGLQVRERMLLAGGLVALIAFGTDSLLLTPARQQLRIEQARLAEQQARFAEIETRLMLAQAQSRQDPDAASRERIGQLREEIEVIRQGLDARLAELISPAEMARVLQALAPRISGISLEAVRSLAPRTLDRAVLATDAREEQDIVLYKRGVELELRGDFASLLAYLEAMEALPWRIGWDLLSIRIEQYPRARFILRVHTLSLEEGWIGV